MSSSIDATKPTTGSPTTSSVRSNFTAAKAEIDDLQRATRDSVTATGTVDALIADFANDVVLSEGVTIVVKASGANTIDNPTLDADSTGIRTIVIYSGDVLAPGSIAGDRHHLVLKYDAINSVWMLMNPAPGAFIGVTAQAFSTNLNDFSGKTAPTGDVVGTTDTQTLSGKTLDDVIHTGSVEEEVFILTGVTPALDPANGTIQTWVLTANSIPTDSLSNGEYMTLMADDGTGAFDITWPTILWAGGQEPILPTTGLATMILWKVAGLLYGAKVGNMS